VFFGGRKKHGNRRGKREGREELNKVGANSFARVPKGEGGVGRKMLRFVKCTPVD